MILSSRYLCALLLAFVLIASCNESDSVVELNDVEVLEIIQSMTFSGESLLLDQLSDNGKNNDFDFSEFCDAPILETFTGDYNRDDIMITYNSKLSIEVTCIELPGSIALPEQIIFDVSTDADYTRPVIDAAYTSVISGTVTEILSIDPLLINYDITANGSQVLTVREERTALSTLSFEVTDLAIDKTSFEIISGLGSFVLDGTVSGDPFSYTGAISFNGGNMATIELNGNSYEIDWNF